MRKTTFAALLVAGSLTVSLSGPLARTAAADPPKPAWPTLAQQLATARASAGSPLAQLIAANQETNLLCPGEERDRRRLPPWIRVWWRKAHPETGCPGDPTGGYPLVLKEILEWMEEHPTLVPGKPEAPVPPPGRAATISQEQRISDPAGRRSESDIRVDYRNPQRVIAASNNIVASGFQVQYFSSNGGSTWGRVTLTPALGDNSHSDPTVDWTSDGTAWTSTLGIIGSTLRLRTYTSADGGATWTFDATPSGAQGSVDKQMMWVDHDDASPHKDNIYLIWHNGQPVFMGRRTAGAWQAPVQVSSSETTGTGIGADVKTNSAGDVFGFWPDTGSRRIYRVKSTNGGASYSAPAIVASTFGSFDIAVPSFNQRQALIYVTGGAYRTATKNLVYAIWNDLSGVAGCNTPAQEPGASVASACKTRIWFIRSTDGGATWEPPKKINDQASLNDQYNPWMVVDEVNGGLAVVYYDTVGDPGRKKTDLWYQSSDDDGVTWSAPVKVTSAQTDETVAGSDTGNQYGDYNGLSGIANRFLPIWTDRRGGVREEIWTAALENCTVPGVPTLDSVTAPADNLAQISWTTGSPAGDRHHVYRATGSCAAPGPFSRIAMAVPGATYGDSTVSGGIVYSYRVSAVDSTGLCESAQSNCLDVTATGPCIEPPAFAGLATVTNPATPSCALQLGWAAATPFCGGPVTYQIYRSTTPGFTPGPGDLLASGVTGLSYLDSGPLTSGTTYYYVVRAVDTANGNADGNTVIRSNAPSGPITSVTLNDTFEGSQSGGGFDLTGWTRTALTGAVNWVSSTAQSQTPTHSWFSASQTTTSDRVLVSPTFGIQASTTLRFWHRSNFETNAVCTPSACCDAGTLEISTNGGASWTVLPDAAFTLGGFNGTISGDFANVLAGARGWCDDRPAFTEVRANLGAFDGADAKLRWHAADDSSVANEGWFVDSLTLENTAVKSVCTSGAAPLTLYNTVAPCRLVDTRLVGQGPAFGSGETRTYTLSGACGVPAGATAVAINVTVTQPTSLGHITIFPADQAAPATAIINFASGQTRSNNAVMPIDATGAIKVRATLTGTVDFILDINGYFLPVTP